MVSAFPSVVTWPLCVCLRVHIADEKKGPTLGGFLLPGRQEFSHKLLERYIFSHFHGHSQLQKRVRKQAVCLG